VKEIFLVSLIQQYEHVHEQYMYFKNTMKI